MKVNIVIPFYNNLDTIDQLFYSLDDQDYKNFDVTVVIDGKDEDGKHHIEDLKTKFSLYVHMLDVNRGASNARNVGAKLSKDRLEGTDSDNILFFIDADCKLYPGMLRECVLQLEMNPSVDFVYGNYRFDDQFEFISQPFDAYLLETMNYICTMSPVRRSAFENVGGFIDDQPYFQDWSLFYRLSQAGSKGHWINEFIFSTKSPSEDNISGTQCLTLDQKASVFRKEHDISDKPLVVTTFAAPLQAIQRAKMLDADYCGKVPGTKRMTLPSNFQFNNWKATYVVGGFNKPISVIAETLAVSHGRPIIHFIGTDVYQLITSHPVVELRAMKKLLEKHNAVIYANSPRLVDELKECGIEASLLYTPIYDMARFKPEKLPEKFTVGVYFNEGHELLDRSWMAGQSCTPMIEDIAQSCPDIDFKFFGGKLKDESENIEYCGRIPNDEMTDFINSCSAVLRVTIHDGFPQLPIQFMLCGRQAVVTTPEMPLSKKLSFEDWIDDKQDYTLAKDEIITSLYDLKNSSWDPEKLSEKAHSEYSKLMSEETFKKEIYSCL